MADFKVKSLSNVMGAEITGLDLNNKLSNEVTICLPHSEQS